MFVLGLTGSIGMGKSATATVFRRAGIPVYDADAAVHRLLGKNGAAVRPIAAAFDGVVHDNQVDRVALGAQVFGKPAALRKLERIVHPLVGQMQRRFLRLAALRREPLVVLDVPLLMENNGETRTDAIVVVSAPYFIQKQRVLARPDSSIEKFHNILRQQVPDHRKRVRADFIVRSSLGHRPAWLAVRRIIRTLRGRPGRVWPPTGRPAVRPARHPSRRPIHRRARRQQGD